MELVIGRLKDKSSNVRKHAVVLVASMLKHNPFAPKVCILNSFFLMFSIHVLGVPFRPDQAKPSNLFVVPLVLDLYE